MIPAVFVALGAIPGALCRFYLQSALNQGAALPWGTLTSNLFGCFLAGVVLWCGADWPQLTKSFVMAGVLGALTTFSSFVTEVATMFIKNQYPAAFLYFSLTVTLTVFACGVGWFMSQKLFA